MLRSLGVRLSGGLIGIVALIGMAGGTLGCGKFFPPLSDSSSTACTSGTTGCTVTDSYMYIANQSASYPEIAGVELITSTQAASGTTPASSVLQLSGTPNSNYALSAVPQAMAITPSNSYLYVSGLTGGIYVYSINTDYSITLQTNESPVGTSTIASSMVVDPSGSYLLVLNASLSATSLASFDIYQITSSTGALTSVQSGPVQTAGISQQIAITSSNTSIGGTQGLVAVTLGTGGIEAYTFNSATGGLTFVGRLSPKATSAGSNGDVAIAIDPSNSYVFATETVAQSVRAFAITKTTGALTEVGTSPYAVGTGPSAVLVDSSGAYVYVANSTSNTISEFTLGTGGALTAVSGSPIATCTTPLGLAEDSTKTYIGVVCKSGTQNLQLYSFDSTTKGKLDAEANQLSTGNSNPQPGIVVALN